MDTSFFGDVNFAEFGGPAPESTPMFPSSSNDPFGTFADPFADFGSAAVPATGNAAVAFSSRLDIYQISSIRKHLTHQSVASQNHRVILLRTTIKSMWIIRG